MNNKNDYTQNGKGKMSEPRLSLQDPLARRIIGLVHEDQLAPGDRLNESLLAERLKVSRSPVRAALARLQSEGILEYQPNRGMILVELPPATVTRIQEPGEDLLVVIARFRRDGELKDAFTEAEVMRMTAADRPQVRQALTSLENLGMVRRRSGYGWEFTVAVRDAKARAESFRFRILIECAAILEPEFHLDGGWIAMMRERHTRMMRAEWVESSSVAFFEMNAEFHQGISDASGNRYLADAMHRQNQLRRLSNYNWRHGAVRVQTNCQEHLEMLDRFDEGDHEMASLLMKKHLTDASRVTGQADT
ncbi:GntR family transcriptional regulator [Ensifer sp. 4252]|uniref:GntR family transcriptional regulator n=1 Tax=Ensifer sp. 4252 TaxID=3373915 RepID=UPI003D211BBE